MYPMYYYGFDWTYIVLVLPCILLSLWASANVNSTFQKYSSQFSRRHLTGAEAAQRVLYAHGVRNVRIERVSGKLTDHYDPRANVIRLSDEVYGSTSTAAIGVACHEAGHAVQYAQDYAPRSNVIRLSDNVYGSTSTAAIGVACHEAGHAVQYAQDYAPIRIRSAVIPATNLGSKLAMPLILLGLLIGFKGDLSYFLVYLGIGCFGLSLVFQLVTLPVEFDASRRAMAAIAQSELLTEEEQRGARKTLSAAALTYVAATAVALSQLLRLLILFGGRRKND